MKGGAGLPRRVGSGETMGRRGFALGVMLAVASAVPASSATAALGGLVERVSPPFPPGTGNAAWYDESCPGPQLCFMVGGRDILNKVVFDAVTYPGFASSAK